MRPCVSHFVGTVLAHLSDSSMIMTQSEILWTIRWQRRNAIPENDCGQRSVSMISTCCGAMWATLLTLPFSACPKQSEGIPTDMELRGSRFL